jgi:Tol biopolymer transport system component
VARETTGVRHFAISRAGALAYVAAAGAHALVLADADGSERLVTEDRLSFENPQFSPDGRRLAVATSRRPGETADIWIHDLETGTASRLTFEGGRAPVWTPDGAAVTFSQLTGSRGLFTKPADGRGPAEQLLALDEFHWLVGWTPDGRTLAFGAMEPPTGDGTSRSSIVAVTDGTTRRVVGPGPVWGGRLSPDGKWVAYYSLESGRFEVYVAPFPQGGTRWLISEDGGRDPSWAPDGREVYYRSDDRLMAARVDMAAGVRVVTRRLVLEPFSPPLYDDYDAHPDGRTLVLVRPAGNPRGHEVAMILNWFTELRRLVR